MLNQEKYLEGRPIIGFWSLFSNDYGDENVVHVTHRITPSRAGNTLLPFHCPRCEKVLDFSNIKEREEHRDDRLGQGNYFCPYCGFKFYLNLSGSEVSKGIDKGGAFPSIVESLGKTKDGLVEIRRQVGGKRKLFDVVGELWSGYLVGCDILGAV